MATTASTPRKSGVCAPGSDPAVAIPALLGKHGPRLHSVALRLCGNRADADDMVQEVFLQAFRKWHTFKGNADPGTWLYAIAARSCKARMRRKGGVDRRMPAVSQLMPWREHTVMEVAAAPEDEEDPAERQEAIARVQGAIARLPEHLRIPLVLKEVLGVSVHDVGGALGLAENTVKTRLHRARLALRKSMAARAASVEAPAPIYEKQVCMDLLKAKMDAMDRGGTAAGFRVPQAEVCARCRAVFRELDLVQDACGQLAEGEMPAKLRAAILRAVGTVSPAQRGRRPVKP
ncbi:MAG TPA: sigma-70 family RNA polymerase sigma factor [Phycisphaerales bacterium]|nr:sigma-70 family RNA polymerase sigma factor [Phycisphaerales bacterium]